MNKETGEIPMEKLNKVVHVIEKRKDGSIRHAYDYSNCPTMTEQHAANLNDINFLMQKFKPDELAAYMAAKSANRTEIIGHDFANEPNLQGARNITYQVKKQFDELAPEIKNNFRNHVEFIKFIDNPANQKKLIKMGLMTPREIQKQLAPIQINKPNEQTQEQKSQQQTTKNEAPK